MDPSGSSTEIVSIGLLLITGSVFNIRGLGREAKGHEKSWPEEIMK